jgi:hypothetical protein
VDSVEFVVETWGLLVVMFPSFQKPKKKIERNKKKVRCIIGVEAKAKKIDRKWGCGLMEMRSGNGGDKITQRK